MVRFSVIAALTLAGIASAQDQPAKPDAEKPAQPAPAQPATPEAPKEAPAGPSFFSGEYAELLSEGHTFVEGPCWVPTKEGGFFLFCDRVKDGGKTLRWSGEGKPEDWRVPSGSAIGTAVDSQGRIYQAETQGRRITRTALQPDGKPGLTEIIADKYQSSKLNATNDLVVKKDGAVYFTDPTFFTAKEDLQMDFCGIFRAGADGKVTLLDNSVKAPNGLCFSPDESLLYVNEYSLNKVMVFDVKSDGTIENGRTFIDFGKPTPQARGRADGIRCDADGNVYTTGPLGIVVLSPKGERVGALHVMGANNLAFGGKDGKTLLITAGNKVYTIKATHKGAGF
ncbi:gluconolactonase [Phycisphaerales bacterium]|nr:gluconolactonase [Phycisphaerales bacterium]